jgi:hypothetical protein
LPVGPSQAYFAPSLLVDSPSGFKLGVYVLHQQFDIRYRSRPDGVDVSPRIFDARGTISPTGAGGIRYLPTEDIVNPRGSHDPSATTYYLTFGSVHHIIEKYLSLGIYTTIPITSFQAQQPYFVDEREQFFTNSLHFELYEDRAENSAFALALASKPLPWFSLGLGVTLTMTAHATSRVYLSEATDNVPPVVNPEVNIQAGFVPHGSLTFEPLEKFRITATFHWRYKNPVKADHKQQLWGYESKAGEQLMEFEYRFAYGYEPIRVGLGLSYTGDVNARLSYEVAASAMWVQWSDYHDRQNQIPQKRFSDTFPATLYSAFSIDDMHRVALDLTFVPTPVPKQDGRSNYLDNHRLGVALGYELMLTFKRFSMTLGAHVQGHALFTRSVAKSPYSDDPILDEFPDAWDVRTDEYIAESAGLQTNNPGFPGYSSDGWLLGGGLTVTFHLS